MLTNRSILGRRGRQGWTLVELLVASSASVLIMASLMTTMYFTMRSFKVIGNYGEMNQTSRYALDLMNRDIRAACAVTSCVTTSNGYIASMTFSNISGTQTSYTWDATNLTFTRYYTSGGSTLTKVLLTNVDNFTFTVLQRTPGTNLTFTAATNLSDIKLIYVDWKCSRTIGGAKENTESMQTAQITMRN